MLKVSLQPKDINMIGKTISHYHILEKLGEGGNGVVYRAEDLKLKRTVALKFLSYSYALDADAKKRFIHEAQSASALDHPNIYTIHEIGETEDGKLFISMTHYEGENLKDKIKKGRLNKEQVKYCNSNLRRSKQGSPERNNSSRYKTGKYICHKRRYCKDTGFRFGKS